ncbi:unnamed protein product, partial [Mesorhabditis belari]|uniref:Anaphase-promoting complex subunit 2 n=1 Tax=Mesorhabditis belari TaxID=2138241 RepID=A0AAF3JC12_9BILA
MDSFSHREIRISNPFVEGSQIEISYELDENLPLSVTYHDYCLKSARKFLLECFTKQFEAWLGDMKKANLPRAQLMVTMHHQMRNIRKCLDELFGSLCGQDTKLSRSVRIQCMNWFMPTPLKNLFSDHMSRIFLFSIISFVQVSLEQCPVGERAHAASMELLQDILNLVNGFREELTNEVKNIGDPFFQSSIEHALHVFVQASIKKHVATTLSLPAKEELEKEFNALVAWIEKVPMKTAESTASDVRVYMECLFVDQYIDKIYNITIAGTAHSAEIIDIIGSFMQRNNGYGRQRIINRLTTEVNRQLLNISASTALILTSYANAVTSLRRLDPSTFIMHIVCGKIKNYLKQHRTDTVRQIISFITKAGHQFNDQMQRCVIIDDEDALSVNDEFLDDETIRKTWRSWRPDPPDALHSKGRVQRSADVFTMLVSIYGSKDSFVKEYRQLLAERLTQAAHKDPAFESRYLNLLRLRFSEAELQQCEVMLKDICDSENLMEEISAAGKLVFPLSARIISTYFWPDVNKDKTMEFPSYFDEHFAVFEQEYKKLKHDRKLNWMKAAGCVEMTLTIDGMSVDKVVTNSTAAVLYPFLEQEAWTAIQLIELLKMPRSVVQKRLGFWQSQRVLINSGEDTWTLTTQPNDVDQVQYAEQEEDEEEELDETDREKDDGNGTMDELEQYWTYTRNFINGQEQKEMRAERLFGIYKMFGIQSLTLEQVVAFLKKKVSENLLSINNGFYRVVKE